MKKTVVSDELVIIENSTKVEPDESSDPKIGLWYFIKFDADDEPSFGCVTHIGSNYVEVTTLNERSHRIHQNEFWTKCEFVPDPDQIIDKEISNNQRKVQQLIAQVHELTSRLAIIPGLALSSKGETYALTLRTDQPMDDYKTALEKAKKEDLPELFKQIEKHNKTLSKWMSAKLIPLKAQAESLNPIIEAITNRIFSVQLYAGLVETIEQIKQGKPGSLKEKIRLLQRRCYMDEECLAKYETGGMEFNDIGDFDKWLSKPGNFERILPYEKCVVAFRVRRNEKTREVESIRDLFKMIEDKELDLSTFLYIRNGEQLFRLQTQIDFGHQLFPDMTESQLEGKLWAKMGSSIELCPDGRYQEMLESERVKAAKAESCPPEERWRYVDHWPESERYVPFSPDNVHYDDIVKHIQEVAARHNRLVLVLQGLLDRSPVLHPHPPWSLWSQESFQTALELIYDDSRALVSGDAPDFEEYRASCNASLKTGSVTVGQEVAWEVYEAEKESARRDRDHRSRSEYRPERFRPYGDPGPGKIARVQNYKSKSGQCTYVWTRSRVTWSGEEKFIDRKFSTNSQNVLNVDAYKPGDFRKFFDDPRTRADYLKWASFLLMAEEYHAGNLKVPELEKKIPKKQVSTWEGRKRYEMRKRRKALIGKAVRLTTGIVTKGGKTFAAGSLWRVISGVGDRFCIASINPTGERSGSYMRDLSYRDLEIDPSIPDSGIVPDGSDKDD